MNEEHARCCGSPEWAAYLQSEVLAPLLAGVDLGAELLELGPGPGAATAWLRQRVGRLTAIEVDPAAAERLRRRFAHDNVAVLVGDCAAAAVPAGAFDSVGCFTMLHHVATAAEQRAVLSEAFRVLRPGGVLAGSDSLASNDLHHFHAGDTYNPVEPARLLHELLALGFRPVAIGVRDAELTFRAHKPALPDRPPGATRCADPEARDARCEPADQSTPKRR